MDLSIRYKTEPIGAENCTRMEDTAIADLHPFPHGHMGIKKAIGTNLDPWTDMDERTDPTPSTDFNPVPYH